jgi:purine-binding chemotaxis protein CheW
VFHIAGQIAALPLEDVESIAPMAQLVCPPGLPSPLEGILNLAGAAVPVLRLDHLLQLPEKSPGLYSMLVVMKGVSDGQIALLVDRVSEVLSVSESALLPIGAEHSFNGCAEATVPMRGQLVHLLAPARLLLENERKSLSEFQAIAQARVQEWETGKQ